MPIQILLLIAIIAADIVAWKRVREGVISAREALLWTCVWLVAAVVVALPNTTTLIANMLGVGRGVDLVVYGAIILLFFLLFKIFVHLDKLESKLTDIVRKDALKDVESNVKRKAEEQSNEAMKQ
jgi:small membrane protein